MKLLISVQRISSYFPVAWFVLFILFILRVYFKIGFFPSYNKPDPEQIGFVLHYGLLFFNYYLVIFWLIVWVPITIILLIKNRSDVSSLETILFVVSYIVFFFFPRIDPLGLATWFFD